MFGMECMKMAYEGSRIHVNDGPNLIKLKLEVTNKNYPKEKNLGANTILCGPIEVL